MTFIHIMADGSVRDSVKGVVIESDEFYEVLKRILERKAEKK